MKSIRLIPWVVGLGTATFASFATGAEAADTAFLDPLLLTWTTVVNSQDQMPGAPEGRTFNSFNQPSVNTRGLVVMRARSTGGPPFGPATHGIYTRDMSAAGNPVVRILDRKAEVPQPNNLHYPPEAPGLTMFVETPSFPRIDLYSDSIATRGNHQPVWEYPLDDGTETRAGTTGIYTNPFGSLITGAAKLGAVPGFEFWAVPGIEPQTAFDVFPGSPSITRGRTIVFKGNYTVDGEGKTGVFYRNLTDKPIVLPDGTELAPAGGESRVMLIANSTETVIPGTDPPVIFGSTSPPAAAGGRLVFAGFDNEEQPTVGGIYLAPIAERPTLKRLVRINQRVPGETSRDRFNALGEGGAYDGRFVGFWGAWGKATWTKRLYCPQEGNKDRIDYCNQQLVCADTGETLGDPGSICDDVADPMYGISCYQERQIPVHQGIFVQDTLPFAALRAIAKTGEQFDDFLFWNYSGKVPCVGSGHSAEGGEDDGEPARWRSSAFVAVAKRYTAFKAVAGDVVGIYLGRRANEGIVTVLDTTTDAQVLDPGAPAGATITEIGLEREGLRGSWLVINAKMGIAGGSEEDGLAGIYITSLPKP